MTIRAAPVAWPLAQPAQDNYSSGPFVESSPEHLQIGQQLPQDSIISQPSESGH